jgi:hypothetical protein
MRPLHSLCLPVLLVASVLATAVAAEPSPINDTAPSCISLVGTNGAVPAPIGQFTVICRDLANNPLPGAVVTIDLSFCPELFLCADQLDPDATVNCAYKTVSKLTAADGSVHFNVLGGSSGSGSAVTLLNGGRIYRNGVLIASPTVSAFDLDGSGGVGANDISAWLVDFSTGIPYGRSDYDCSGNVGANDLSMLLIAFGSGAMAVSCASQCP